MIAIYYTHGEFLTMLLHISLSTIIRKFAALRPSAPWVCLLSYIIWKKVLPVANAPNPGPILWASAHSVPTHCTAEWKGGIIAGYPASSACFVPVRKGSCYTWLLALSLSQHNRGNDNGHKSSPREEKCIVYEDSTGMTASATPTPYKSLPTCNCDGVLVEDGGWFEACIWANTKRFSKCWCVQCTLNADVFREFGVNFLTIRMLPYSI